MAVVTNGSTALTDSSKSTLKPATASGVGEWGGRQAVSRSAELLVCARTALRMAHEEEKKKQQQQQQTQHDDGHGGGNYGNGPQKYLMAVEDLHLWQPPYTPDTNGLGAVHIHPDEHEEYHDEYYYSTLPPQEKSIIDSLRLLRAVDTVVSDLQSLVRRRGHTNDPTDEIGSCMKRFQSLMSELLQMAESIKLSRKGQLGRHYEIVALDVQNRAKIRTERFQSAMQQRSEVLKVQARRRKMLSSSNAVTSINGSAESRSAGVGDLDGATAFRGNGSGSVRGGGIGSNTAFSSVKSAAVSQLDSPLFTMTSGAAYGSGVGVGGSAAMRLSGKRNVPAAAKSVGSVPSSASSYAKGKYGGSSGGRPPLSANSKSAPGVFGGQNGPSYSSSLGVGANQASAGGYGYGGAAGTDGMRRRGGHQYQSAEGNRTGTSYSSAYSSAYVQAQRTPYYPQNDENGNFDNNDEYSSSAEKDKIKLQKRKHLRETKQRVETARQAEQAIATISQMFNKMATLIHSQSEIIENIEDDVEAASVYVDSGAEEITKLYHITKGNRGLILKVFGILIALILFFRLY